MKQDPVEQMKYNVGRWIRDYGWPEVEILDSPAPQMDHCFLKYDSQLQTLLQENMYAWNVFIKLPDHWPLGYPTAIKGWREKYNPRKPMDLQYNWAAQVILHYDPSGLGLFFEIDFDANNPAQGLIPAIWHGLADFFGQKVRRMCGGSARTNPFAVAKNRKWDVEEVRA
jgi:hypothetical protein